MVLTLEGCFCLGLQAVCISSAFLHLGLHWNLASQFTSTCIYSRLHSGCTLILLASDDTVRCSDCHRMHIPKNLVASALVAGWAAGCLCLPGISSYALEQETLNPPSLGGTWTLPLLGRTLSSCPPIIGCGFLTKPYLFPRLCNFVLFWSKDVLDLEQNLYKISFSFENSKMV